MFVTGILYTTMESWYRIVCRSGNCYWREEERVGIVSGEGRIEWGLLVEGGGESRDC